jgi:hypothetical protein
LWEHLLDRTLASLLGLSNLTSDVLGDERRILGDMSQGPEIGSAKALKTIPQSLTCQLFSPVKTHHRNRSLRCVGYSWHWQSLQGRSGSGGCLSGQLLDRGDGAASLTSNVSYTQDSDGTLLEDAAIVGKERLSTWHRAGSTVLHVWRLVLVGWSRLRSTKGQSKWSGDDTCGEHDGGV